LNRQKGLILKRENEDCLVLTSDGMFKRIRSTGKAQVGEEIFLPSGTSGFKRILLVAASMCVLAFCCLFYQTNIAQAVAFVSMDFNPSLEMGLNSFKKIVSVKAFDSDAEKMLKKVNIEGQPVDRAVKIILNQARTDGYLDSSPKETILVAVSPAKGGAAQKVTAKEIAGLANQYLRQQGVKTTVITSAASSESHKEAGEKKISLGRYILLEAAKKEGKKISLQEIKEQKLADIEAKHELNLEKDLTEPNSGIKQPAADTRPLKKKAVEKIKQLYLKKKNSEIKKDLDATVDQQEKQQADKNKTVDKKKDSAPYNKDNLSKKQDREKNQKASSSRSGFKKDFARFIRKELRTNK